MLVVLLNHERVSSSKKDVGYYYMSYIWANPTWDFLHSFAARVNEDFYVRHKSEILSLIKSLAAVLPCPECQTHAMRFFSQVKIAHIPTKDTLRQLILRFHNEVNVKTRKQTLSLEDIEKYKNKPFSLNNANFFDNNVEI